MFARIRKRIRTATVVCMNVDIIRTLLASCISHRSLTFLLHAVYIL